MYAKKPVAVSRTTLCSQTVDAIDVLSKYVDDAGDDSCFSSMWYLLRIDLFATLYLQQGSSCQDRVYRPTESILITYRGKYKTGLFGHAIPGTEQGKERILNLLYSTPVTK